MPMEKATAWLTSWGWPALRRRQLLLEQSFNDAERVHQLVDEPLFFLVRDRHSEQATRVPVRLSFPVSAAQALPWCAGGHRVLPRSLAGATQTPRLLSYAAPSWIAGSGAALGGVGVQVVGQPGRCAGGVEAGVVLVAGGGRGVRGGRLRGGVRRPAAVGEC
jgi:hypothetical protein